MTQAPHLLPKSREGFKYGDTEARRLDGLRRPLRPVHLAGDGRLTEGCNAAGANLTREEQDAFAAQSHQRPRSPGRTASSTTRSCPVTIPQPQGRHQSWSPRTRASAATPPWSPSASCGPPSAKDGTITAGSASQISDGACAVVVMSKAKAEELGLTWLAEIGAPARSPAPTRRSSSSRPTRSRRPARRRASRPPTSTSSSSTRRSPPSASRRPASSASRRPRSTSTAARSRSATRSACPARGSCCTLALELQRRGGGVGAAALCGGGGQGDALIVRVPSA